VGGLLNALEHFVQPTECSFDAIGPVQRFAIGRASALKAGRPAL